MNTNVINAELALALRKCLPFVKRHAIISSGDGSLTYAFAVRALADADARQQEFERVKRIVEAEQARDPGYTDEQRDEAAAATVACSKAFGYKYARSVLDYVGVRNVGSAEKSQMTRITRLMKMSPSTFAKVVEAQRADAINAADAKMQAARAVRPMPPSPVGGYAPATPPAKNCTCDTCTRYRRSTSNFYKD